MPTDRWLGAHRQITQPAEGARLITPDDDSDLDAIPRALVVNGAVRVTGMDGVTVTLPDLGTWQWDLRPVRVHATGTAATVLVALY